MERVILHIDMDAFYASVERLDNPALRGKPVIVGGISNRGVVSTASYEARKYGVHSAMPIFRAKIKCPSGVFLPVRMERYRTVSSLIMNILESFSPLIEQVSIDEAYVDLSGTGRLFGPPRLIGDEIKRRIREKTSLTCSIGIAPNKFLAKIASDMNKPDGLTVIKPDEVKAFLKRLPVERVPGIGKKTVGVLNGMGVFKLGDVKRVSARLLLKRTGKFGEKIIERSMGIDDSPVVSSIEAKSVSSEETFPEDTNDLSFLRKQLLAQSEIVGRRLRSKGVKGFTVTLKLKHADFSQITRSLTLEEPLYSSQSIFRQGIRLLEDVDRSMKFRLIGIGISNLVPSAGFKKQLNLFDSGEPENDTWGNAEKAMDTIRMRFGHGAIKRGGVMEKKNPRAE